jgi:hypothetical protein
MTAPPPHDHWHWRSRAVEMIALAKTIEGDEAKETMLRIAAHYDHLARRAEQRALSGRIETALPWQPRPV